MRLETMTPADSWEGAGVAEAIDVLARHRDAITVRVWGGDWCGDCQALLPDFAAALAAAGIDPGSVPQYPVEKREDGTKVGPMVEAYGIDRIPTIVLERDGEELVRYVESAEAPAAVVLADALGMTESVR